MEENKNKPANGGTQEREWKAGTGALFANEYHKPGDRQPSMRGVVVGTDGQKYHAVAWTRFNSTTGAKYLSLSVQPYEEWQAERDAAKAKRASAAAADADVVTDGEDLPF